MRLFPSILAVPVLAIASAIGLNGCTSPAYYLNELETVPLPRPVLLRRLPKPDCLTAPLAIPTKKRAKSRAPVAANNNSVAPQKKAAKERNSSTTEQTPEADTKRSETKEGRASATPNDPSKPDTPTAKKDVTKSPVTIDDLKKERDCYRQAEQRARIRLQRLQASAADTVATLDEVKRKLHSSMVARPHYSNRSGPSWQ